MGSQLLNIVIIGASGDLSLRKIFPSLFALFARDFLSDDIDMRIYGYARSDMDTPTFREQVAEHLVCEELGENACGIARREFLERCGYWRGDYGDAGRYRELDAKMRSDRGGRDGNTIWYLAIPPSVFSATVQAIGAASLVHEGESPWTRVVVEKPFGRDRESSDALTHDMIKVFAENQVFRIDHYLGKEVIQNLMVLRFANRFFEPLWNREHIHHVHIAWKEDRSLEGRGGYFDAYGIIRDVMQNHMTQMLALIGMESPWAPGSHFVRDEKVRLLRQVQPLRLEDIALGQYIAGRHDGRPVGAYRDEQDVPDDSLTPTYAAAVMRVMSPRWRGVPFLVSAGKGVDSRVTEIRLHFRPLEHRLFETENRVPPANELVIRVQPDEDIHLRIVSKTPGPGMRFDTPKLDLSYSSTYNGRRIADAYENLLLDVVRGERGLFIRSDELEAAWDIFSPVLNTLEERGIEPEPYPFGGTGPDGVKALARRHGIEDPHPA